jgi:hypothetical protein
MKKSIIILTAIALIAGGCGQKTSKQQENTEETFDKSTVFFRPNEKIQRGKVYNDTLAYSGVSQSEYGSFQLFGLGGDAYYFTIDFDVEKSDLHLLHLDDLVVVKWRIDEDWFGNPNLFVLTALSIKKIDSPQRKVKYRFRINEKVISFFEDGNAESTDYTNFEVTYKEYPNYLLLENERRDLFDDFGHIEPYWEIFNFHNVNSRMQITNFEENPEKIDRKKIQDITETFLILITPEQSVDANEEYDPVIEWQNYAYDRKEEYEAKGIKSVDAEKRYLSFTLYEDEKITVDTKKKQNGTIYSALLYRKGYIPIMISISGESEEGKEMIEWYFGESGDGDLPFKRWNLLKE